jgi:hypothetical protein
MVITGPTLANEQVVPPIIVEPMEHGDGRPAEQARPFGSLAHRESRPPGRFGEMGLHERCFFAPAAGGSEELDRLTCGNGQHIVRRMRFQPGAQVQVAA